MNSFIILQDGLVVFTNGKQYTVDKTHVNYALIVEAIKAADWDSIPNLVDIASHINATGKDVITVVDGAVMYGNQEVHNTLTVRLLDMLREGFNIDPMIALLKNLMSNPTSTAIDEFYLFIENNRMPITEDGCILAYKRVSYEFKDCYTNRVVNKPAHMMTSEELEEGTWKAGNVTTTVVNGVTTVEMPRNLVDNNRQNDCSVGLHFCSLAYLGEFTGDNILIVKVNPADIVSIPYDYNNTKGRCWRYEIVGCLDIPTALTAKESAPVEDVYNVAVVPSTVVSNDHLAYNQGYVDGRSKLPSNVEDWRPHADVYSQGYKDGRGKQKRKYPAIK